MEDTGVRLEAKYTHAVEGSRMRSENNICFKNFEKNPASKIIVFERTREEFVSKEVLQTVYLRKKDFW